MEKKIKELRERMEMAETIQSVYEIIEHEMKNNTMHGDYDENGDYVYTDLPEDHWRYESAMREQKVYKKVLEYLEKMV